MSEGQAAVAAPDNGGNILSEPAPEGGASGDPQPRYADGDWRTGLEPEYQDAMDAAHYENPNDLAKGYYHLRNKMGAGPEELIRVPKEDDADGWQSVHKQLGMPDTAEDYDLGEGVTPEESKWYREMAHKNGLSKQQAKEMFDGFAQTVASKEQEIAQQDQQRIQNEYEEIKSELGPKWEDALRVGRQAAKSLNLDNDQMNALQKSLGPRQYINIMKTIGEAGSEASFMDGDSGNPRGGMSPGAARGRIDALQNDPDFQSKITSHDTTVRNAARAQLFDLYKQSGSRD